MALIEKEIKNDLITCWYNSANILLSEYVLSKQLLDITFRNGQKYRYYHVNPQNHAGLQMSESTGQYFHTNIRTHAFKKMGVVPISEHLRRANKRIT